ncbi:hypothetical protein [Streptosporangium saharense]|uniref:Uncharacterized protein n=1 Tax=Streptosporangium saharense TaxID=1706840 RepID=A0A7W7QWA2_9ACTN|nr:hypothetical protein [Streptosporangium saharense]MBB4920980.1 hypothetical protein [Streptosporangium saharense]
MGSIIPLPQPRTAPDLDPRPLAYALSRMAPGLTALVLPGEDWDAMMARRQAAADILDDLLAEFAAEAEAVTW